MFKYWLNSYQRCTYIIIEQEGVLDVVGNMLVGLMDKFVDPDFSKTLKKLKEEREGKYLWNFDLFLLPILFKIKIFGK